MFKKVGFSILLSSGLFAFDLGSITSSVTNLAGEGLKMVVSNEDGQKIHVDKECTNMYESYEVNYKAALSVSAKYAVSNSGTITNWMTKNSTTTPEEASKLFKEYAKKVAKESFWIPVEVEKYYGELTLESRKTNNSVILPNTKNPKYKKMYTKINAFLEEYRKSNDIENIPFDIKVLITTNTKSAETTPYGYIYISEDLLKRRSYKTIIAHEISHVSKRHAVKELQFRLVKTYSTVTDAMKLIKDVNSDGYTKTAIGIKALELVNASFDVYSHDQELEADACGLRKMALMNEGRKHIYVNEIINNINYMSQDEIKDSTHPSKVTRIDNIKNLEKSL